MLPITALAIKRLVDAGKGDLFMPRIGGDERYLLGTLNSKYKVAIEIDNPAHPFHDSDAVGIRRGFVITDYDLSVDPESSAAFRPENKQMVPTGSLVLSGDNVGVFAQSAKNGSSHVVMLRGEGQISDDDGEAVAFTEWKMTTKTVGESRTELFRFPPPELL